MGVIASVHGGAVQQPARNVLPGRPDSYPGKDEVAEFLRSYVAKFDLPVRLNTTVTRLTRDDEGYLAETTSGPIRAKQVVVATGPFQVPFIPPVSEQVDPELPQLHSSAYRRPEDLPEGRVLVVGGANSGQQIALELSESRSVEISVGQKLPTLPQRPLGRDIWWWLTATRLARVPVSSRLGQRLSQRDVVIGGGLKELRRHGVEIRPRVVGASGRTLSFDDDASAQYDGIVWATGFRIDHSWIEVCGIKGERGQVRHVRGVTESPGLYMLGMNLAAHANFGTARLGGRRRRLPGRADDVGNLTRARSLASAWRAPPARSGVRRRPSWLSGCG